MKNIFLILYFFSIQLLLAQEENIENINYEKIEDFETRESVDHWLKGDFGLKPHKPNYILPVGYTDTDYKEYENVEYKHLEAELQVSLKLKVAENIFGLNEKYFVAYSHQAFWQIYAKSSPFRETNYSPEGFVSFPIEDNYSMFQLRNVKLGLAHKSNGKSETWDKTKYEYHYEDPNNESRSINYTYIEATLQHHSIVTDIRFWYRWPEDIKDDDNPDYEDYVGHIQVKLNYFYAKHMFCLSGRLNGIEGRGSIEGRYSYPIGHDLYLFGKIFSGYGESLIDYNNYITKFAIGFSFSR